MSMQGPFWSIATRFLEGRAAAAGIALMNMIGIFGGFVGPYWMGIAEDLTGDYRRGFSTMAVPMLVGVGVGGSLGIYKKTGRGDAIYVPPP